MIQIEFIDEIKKYDNIIYIRMSYDITKSILTIHRRDSQFSSNSYLLNIEDECKYENLNSTEESIFLILNTKIKQEYNTHKYLFNGMNLNIKLIEENVNKLGKTSYKMILRKEKFNRLI